MASSPSPPSALSKTGLRKEAAAGSAIEAARLLRGRGRREEKERLEFRIEGKRKEEEGY